MKVLAFILILVWIGTAFGCEKEITCGNEQGVSVPIQEGQTDSLKLQCTLIDPLNASAENIGKKSTYVISTKQDYEAMFECNGKSLPEVDFDQYMILAGSAITSNCGSVSSQQVVNRCGEYTYDVVINNDGVCTVVSKVSFFAVVSKIEKENVKFDIQINP